METDLKERKKAALEEIYASTIQWEMKLMVQLANACMAVVQDVYRRIYAIHFRHKLISRPLMEVENLRGLIDFCTHVKRAETAFFKNVEPTIEDATIYDEGDDPDEAGRTGAQRYDDFNGACNWLVKFSMLYADRVVDSETYSKLSRTLRKMPSAGRFTDADLARFNNKNR